MNARSVFLAAAGMLAVTAIMASPVPARAHEDDWRWHRHEWREHAWHPHYRPYVYAPPPVYVVPAPTYYGW